MTRRLFFMLLLSTALFAAGLQAQNPAQQPGVTPNSPEAAASQPWNQIPIPPLPKFSPPLPKRVELPNGMILFLQEDHELPLISAVARIRGGSDAEPATKIGLVEIYGEVWRTGGTKEKTGDQLDDFLETRAAKVETEGHTDSTSISLDCLKQNFDEVFPLFLELLREPAFREEKLELAKDEVDTGISRRNDDIGQIARRESAALAYGKDSPYAREPEYATVAAIAREDLIKWHDQHVHPNDILLGIIGDFDSATMEKRLRQAFASWKKGPPSPQPKISITPAPPGLYFAEKEDVNQSDIRMVTLGIERSNPDYFAVSVMNEIFGGGFSSRLVQHIRTEKGLAYAVGGGIGAGYDHPGIFQISTGTKTATTAEAIKALNEQIENLLKEPATAAELKRAKDALLSGFIFRIDTPEKVLFERMTYQYYGYPLDFLEKFRNSVEKVTTEDVTRVAHKYVHPGSFAVLAVGNHEAEKLLNSLGQVKKLDISIPTPGESSQSTDSPASPAAKPEVTAPPTASTPQGKELLAKVIDSMGGTAKLSDIKSIRFQSTVTSKESQVPVQVDATILFPDHAARVMKTPMGEMKSVVTPEAAYMNFGGQVRELSPEMKKSGLEDIRRDPLFVVQHANDPEFIFWTGAAEKIGDAEAVILNIDADGAKARWYVDPKSGHILRIAADVLGQRGPEQRVQDIKSWKSFGELSLPFEVTISENGKETATVTVDEVQANSPVDPKLFEKPAAASTGP
ncbi:MAG: pitrilysin family protein [Terriglobales bacterium]|jgi:zinc protease